MNYKKIIILPVMFLVSTLIYIGCCPKVEVSPFYKIVGIGISAYGSARAVVDSGAVTFVDSIYLNSGSIRDCATNSINPASFLMNQSFALKCNNGYCGASGLKNKIQSIKISSDSIYNGILANADLNNLFKVNFGNNIFVSVDSLKNSINENRRQVDFEQFVITTKPANNKGHIFKLNFQFVDGTSLSASTKRIYWN